MAYARIFDKTVIEILQPIPGFTAEQCFHRDLLAQCVQVGGDVQPGWVQQEDGTFADPAVILPAKEAPPEAPTDEA